MTPPSSSNQNPPISPHSQGQLSHRMSMADPIHGIIQFDRSNESHKLLLDIISSRAFQRLRRIKQMGLAEFVFPGATHSRFVHSLGSTHLMMRAIEHLNSLDKGALLSSSMPEFPGITLECLLLVSILIHDIGHTPLSHTLEDILDLKDQGLLHDEHWNRKILTEDKELCKIWQKYNPQLAEAVLAFMDHHQPRHFLSTLVSSQLDMDRLDYLQRDSHYLGVQYGRVEGHRIISNIVIAHDQDKNPVVAVREEATPAIEHYLFGRHQAYKMALHSLDKASEVILKCTLKRFKWVIQQGINSGDSAPELYQLMTDGHQLSVHDFLKMDDCYLWQAISHWAESSEDELLKTLAIRMLKHDLFKFVDLKKYGIECPLTEIEPIYSAMQKHYQHRGLSFEFGFDETYIRPKPLYQPTEDREPIWIKTFRGPVIDLADVSSLPLQVVPDKGQKHLIFVWDGKAKHFLLEQLERHIPKAKEILAEDEE